MDSRRWYGAFWLALALAVTSPSPSQAELEGVDVVRGGYKGRLLFALEKDGRPQIYSADLEGKRIIQLVKENSSYPAPSADGEQLAFVSDRDGNEDIYISSWDGTDPRRLTTAPGPDIHPAWGRNTIFYTSTQGKGDSSVQNISSVPSSGGTPTQITSFEGRNHSPSISSKGEVLAFATDRFWPGSDICLFDLKTKKEHCLLSGSRPFIRPRVSPSGESLSYTFGEKSNYDVGLVSIKTRKQQTVAADGAKEYDSAWSPDEKRLAFISEEGGTFSIKVLSLDNEAEETVVESVYPLKHLAWSGRSQQELETKRLNEQDPLLKVVPMVRPPNYTPPYLAN